jgi:hypothetical protein
MMIRTGFNLVSVLFGGAVLTVGLDQYRPFLGSIGNFSDLLFGAAFALGCMLWLVRADGGAVNSVMDAIRTLEPVLWGGVLFTVGGAIASLGSDAPAESWLVTLKHFGMLCVWLPWAAIVIARYLTVPRAFVLYVAGICLIALMTFSDILLGTHFGGRLVTTPIYIVNFESLAEGVRYGGPTGHPVTLGYISAIGVLLCLAAVLTGPWRRALLPWVAMVACGGAMMISGSRAAFLGVVVGSAIIFAVANKGGRRRMTLVTGGSLALLVVGSRAINLGPQLNPVRRLMESLQPRRSFEADWLRAHDLPLSERLLTHDPLTGYGMENIGSVSPPTKGAFHLPHFILLQSWVTGGLVALLGTVWLYLATLLLGWRAVREGHGMAVGFLAACAAFILMDMVAPGLDQRFKWFPGALLFATLLRTRPAPQPAAVRPAAT